MYASQLNRILHVAVLMALAFATLIPSPVAVHAGFISNNHVGLVSDIGGFNDDGYNEMAASGLQAIQADKSVVPMLYESSSESDYATNLQACVDDGNGLCIAVGFLMAEAVETAATNNPGVQFAILDSGNPFVSLSNLRSVFFDEKQAGYLAGALAGKMSAPTANMVGVVAGAPVPGVVGYVAGYQNGAQCANQDVSVLINYTGTFTDETLGASVAADMITAGADVIFGAAGATGNGAILYAAQDDRWAIGVDVDQYVTVFGNGTVDGSDKMLSSAMKRLDNGVYNTVDDYLDDNWTSGDVVYGLADGGVGLASYYAASVPQAVKDYVAGVQASIIAGTTDVNATCRTGSQIGLVTDMGGVNDSSFNAMAWQGMLNAQVDMGITPMLYESSGGDDYTTKLNACALDGNDLCFGVGYTMGDAVAAAATAYPGTHFAILDYTYDSYATNLRGIWFDSKQSSYLAGALAAKMTSTNTIGAIGGMEIPAVVDFMEGYQNGAQCTNSAVNVLTNYAGDFGNPTLGADMAQDMISRGADVIFAPAGPTGNGAILYSAGQGVWSIGVDVDQYYTVFEGGGVTGADKLMTSVMKRIDNAVYSTIGDEVGASFTSGTTTYDLSDGGVGLAPYHDAAIPTEVQDYLTTLEADIVAGNVDVNFGCRPRFHAEIVENDVVGMDWYPGWSIDLSIDDPGNGVGADVTKTGTVEPDGTVMFSDLGGLSLAPGMLVTMSHDDADPQFDFTKVLTVSTLQVTNVNVLNDTVSGTGPEGEWINVQRCDNTGCSWRRWVQVVSGVWTANFKVAGTQPDEQTLLNIQPGMIGEALQADEDSDNTDYQWHAPDPVTVQYRSKGTQDGWILETGENTGTGGVLDAASGTFRLGDDLARKQYRAILSFGTSGLPDNAIISKATLSLRKQTIVGGGNPFSIFKGLYIDVRKGFFGTGSALQGPDFSAMPTKAGLGPFNPTALGGVYTINLPAGANTAINKKTTANGLTQLRLRFKLDDNNNSVANYISFFSGNYATGSYRPTLTITYYLQP